MEMATVFSWAHEESGRYPRAGKIWAERDARLGRLPRDIDADIA